MVQWTCCLWSRQRVGRARKQPGLVAPERTPARLARFKSRMRWYHEGQLDLDALVTERHPISDINEAIGRLERGEVFGRSILTF